MANQQSHLAAKDALIKWAEDKGISPTDFHKATGYTYQHAWNLLRGKEYPGQETVGRMLAAYGPEAAQLISDALNGTAEGQTKA
jgi:hypothetical protein